MSSETPASGSACSCCNGGLHVSVPGVPGAVLARLEGLGAGYDSVRALEGISLELHRGEILAIVGPNGAGKTTLLRVLAGLHPARVGKLLWPSGRPAVVGYVPQTSRPDPSCPVSVIEFLRLALPSAGWGTASRAARDESVRLAALQTGCEHLLLRRLTALSGGEHQRVLLAFALLRKAELLLLDEPQTGLDARSSQSLADTLVALSHSGSGRCIVLVSHDLHFVARVATRVLCLRGHVCSVGPVADMLALHVGGKEMV